MQRKYMDTHSNEPHISSYHDLFGVWAALITLTIMTVTVSVYGADIYTMSVLTALLIASTKVLVVAFYFMHLKYDAKIYRIMIALVLVLFTSFLVLTIIDYITR
jgi:cytochrome c oxidase subunit 4